MAIATNLSASPYFDDYRRDKNFHRVLFKPSTSVQVRELNQLQTILQDQIERFGDNIFKRGTIVDGCNFLFNNSLPYVKLVDNEDDGTTALPSLYVGNFVRNTSNLVGIIVGSEDGFEATDPDLKTIYVNYINSGNTFDKNAFVGGELLTIYSPSNSIYKIDIDNGGAGYSNTDSVIVTPAIAVTLTSGSIAAGESIYDTINGANVYITDVDSLTLSDQNKLLVFYKPQTDHLQDATSNSQLWTLYERTDINFSGGATGIVDAVYGESARATIRTSAAGVITSVSVTNRGKNYTYAPIVAVKSPDNVSNIGSATLLARNYVAKIQISGVAGSVGNAYAFSVSEGVIYQKGHFIRISPQSIMVSKYDTQPNNVSVGFYTSEYLVDYNQDTSLYDNALGTENEAAPGADRLQLIPGLLLLGKDEAAANNEFLTLVEWNDGNPYKQNQATQYNRIGDEIAKTNYDAAGNFVLDPFQVKTTSTANSTNEGHYYTTVVDPGQAYISGKKVQIRSNYKVDLEKGLETLSSNNVVSLNYGNYIKIKEVGGTFLFNLGAEVSLYSIASNFITNATSSSTVSQPNGQLLGTAKMRSMVWDEGNVGAANTTYRLYLFDIKMNSGKSFDDVRSVYYNGTTYDGVADVVLDTNPTTNKQYAKIYYPKINKLLFPSGAESVKTTSGSSYVYRTVNTSYSFTAGATGNLVMSAPAGGEAYPYTGELSNAQKLELLVVPTANIIQSTLTDAMNVSTSSTLSLTTSTVGVDFYSYFEEGDYVYLYSNAAALAIRRVVNINAANSLVIDSAVGWANNTAKFGRAFPQNVPMPFGTRDGLEANVTAGSLYLDLKHSNDAFIGVSGGSPITAAVAVNVQRTGVSPTPKTAIRNQFVKIRTANNIAGTSGPWCIGFPDVFRLRNVYVANVSTVNTASPNVTSEFYIDHNQNQNFLGLGYLYKNPKSAINIANTDYLLVEFDYFQRSAEGYFDTQSYVHVGAESAQTINSKALSALGGDANSFEVPEIFTSTGEYFDLLNQIDFRPAVANTVDDSDTAAGAAVNPPATEVFNTTTDKKFPFPDSAMTTTLEQYLGRYDDVHLSESGSVYVLKGVSSADPRKRYAPNQPKNTLKLQTLKVPAYPNITQVLSNNVSEIINTKISNEKAMNVRLPARLISPVMTSSEIRAAQPTVYTMEDIGNLERRIRDLEYYASLSILETSITNRVIPSSVDRTLNRFKFGFFADDFSTTMFSEISNPQYAASLEAADKNSFSIDYEREIIAQNAGNKIVPNKFIWSLNHFMGENIPYVDHAIIDQNVATVEPPPPPEDPQPNTVCVPNWVTIANTIIATSNAYYYMQQTTQQCELKTKRDQVVFGNTAAPATLYFYNHCGYTKISIYQKHPITGAETLVADTSDERLEVVDLVAADIAWLTSSKDTNVSYELGPYSAGTTRPILGTSSTIDLTKKFTRGGAGLDYVNYAGKITFNHNPTNGTEYVIVVLQGSKSTYTWRYILEYPTTTSHTEYTTVDVAGCAIEKPPAPCYEGTVKVEHIERGCKKDNNDDFKINTTCEQYKSYDVEVTGLKPLTKHEFHIDDEKQEHCVPKNYTAPEVYKSDAARHMNKELISDHCGKLKFKVHVPVKEKPWVVNEKGVCGGSDREPHKSTSHSSNGRSKFEIKQNNGKSSYARSVIRNRSPDKITDRDPSGNV